MQSLKRRVEEAKRRHPHLKNAAIARASGVKPPSVTDWLNGKTKSLDAQTAHRAAQLFGCDPTWLAVGVGLPNWRIPQLAGVAQDLSHIPFDTPPTITWETVMSEVELPERFVLHMPDDALAPNIMRGMGLIFDTSAPPSPGVGVLVAAGDGQRYIRRYAQAPGGAWLAQAINQAYAGLESAPHGLKILAVMVGRLDGHI
jgi:transcriptional regulator with XRE-family HTH domain